MQERKRSNRSIDTPPREAPRKCKLGARYIGVCNRRMQMAVPARIRNPISWLHASTRSLSRYEIVERPRRMIYVSSPSENGRLWQLLLPHAHDLSLDIHSSYAFTTSYKIQRIKSGNTFLHHAYAWTRRIFISLTLSVEEEIKFPPFEMIW